MRARGPTVNAGSPVMGRYSLSVPAVTTACSALRTAEKTTGRRFSSRYAPTPKFSLLANGSALKRADRWKMTVGGAVGVCAHTEAAAFAMRGCDWHPRVALSRTAAARGGGIAERPRGAQKRANDEAAANRRASAPPGLRAQPCR